MPEISLPDKLDREGSHFSFELVEVYGFGVTPSKVDTYISVTHSGLSLETMWESIASWEKLQSFDAIDVCHSFRGFLVASTNLARIRTRQNRRDR